MPGTPLVLTGERTLPGIEHENYWFRRHEVAYHWLAPFVRGARVLEAGTGEGYGADLLAARAARVVGVDSDPAAVAHAAGRYPRVSFVRADLQRLPVRTGSVEVVASLQVVEHLADQAAFVDECARVLRPAGTLLLTTPNRLTFSPGLSRPVNPFHTREYSARELRELLDGRFEVRRLAGVRHGRRLRRLDRRFGGLVGAQLAAPPPQWDRRLRRAVGRVRAGDFDVSPRDVDTALDLVVVAVRRPG